MQVTIKSLNVDVELKNRGIELEIRNPQGEFFGDLVVTKTQLIWCKGRTKRENGKTISWAAFQTYMNSL